MFNIYECTGQPYLDTLPSPLFIYHMIIKSQVLPLHMAVRGHHAPDILLMLHPEWLQSPSRKKAGESEELAQFVSLATYSLNMSRRLLENSNNN